MSEAYGFTWPGKNEAIREAGRVCDKVLRPVVSESVNFSDTGNIYIEGDNLEALKLLRKSYMRKVKMIYIDPPYNTGNDFIYRDNFAQSESDSQGQLAFTDDGGRNYSRKVYDQNKKSNPRFHSEWCSMIYPRLKVAHDLLRDDGVIFVSIDDGEVTRLRMICDEIFGENNFVAMFPWRKRTAKSDVPFGVSQDYEYILAYAKSNEFSASIEGKGRKYYETPDYPGRPWRIHDLTKQTTASERPNSYFTIINPRTGEEYPASPNRTWRVSRETFKKYCEAGQIIFPGDYDFLKISKPVFRYWKADDELKAGENFGRIAVTTKLPDNVGMSQDGTKEITDIFGGKVFMFPKPTALIRYLMTLANLDPDSIILDFFSGSATTAHAVMSLNAQDSGHRKFIMVQLPESCPPNSEAHKAGYTDICAIGRERIRRAGKSLTASQQLTLDRYTLDSGFRTFRVDTTNFRDVYQFPDDLTQDSLDDMAENIKHDRSDLDLLFMCAADFGLPLSLPYHTEIADGFTVHVYGDNDIAACFGENISEETVKYVAEKNAGHSVFREACFDGTCSRINMQQIFEAYNDNSTLIIL